MKRFASTALAVLAMAPFLAAQDSVIEQPPAAPSVPEEVKVWVDKLGKLVGKAAEYDMTMVMDMEAQGQKMKMSSTGHILMLDETHMRATMKMNIEMEIMPAMEMNLLTVMDGQTMWIESDNPMMGKQIMKADVAVMKKLQAQGTSMSPGGNMNQLAQIQDLFTNFFQNFEVTEADGKVTITGDITEEIAERGDFAGMGLTRFRMVLDAKSGFPIETAMGDGKKDAMVIQLKNLKFPKKEEIAKDAFTYEPPEGSPVMDIGAMMGAMGEGGGEGF